jgi:TPR repeat protein
MIQALVRWCERVVGSAIIVFIASLTFLLTEPTMTFSDGAGDDAKSHTIDEVYDLMIEKKYDLARRELVSLSDSGNAEAEYLLGEMFEKGLGTTSDPERAWSLYRASADQGYAPAEQKIGVIEYQAGHYAEALKILLPLAEKGARGEVSAAVSNMYAQGLGTPVDKAKADCWMQKTIERPNQTNSGC